MFLDLVVAVFARDPKFLENIKRSGAIYARKCAFKMFLLLAVYKMSIFVNI